MSAGYSMTTSGTTANFSNYNYVIYDDLKETVDKSEYDILKKIILDFIMGAFECDLEHAENFLEMEIKLRQGEEIIEKPKEWIDSKLFKI